MISVEGLGKTFRVQKRPPGLLAGVKALFHREYTTVEAARDVSFRIDDGERVGFLGPNGAGKTTTLKMLAGLLQPSAGKATVGGLEPFRRSEAFLASITLVLGQKQQLVWDLPPQETFELNRAIYGVSLPEFRKTTTELVELLEIGEQIKRPTRQLSLGERMKCELACALIHRPKYLFLDEPTIGLDVNMQETIRTFIRGYNEQYGATLMLTSHYMADVTALCPRIILIDKGSIAFDGELADLMSKGRTDKRVRFSLSREVPVAELRAVGNLVEHGAAEATFEVQKDAVSALVAHALQVLPVRDLSVTDPPLEEIMRAWFAKEPAQEPA